jgi:hypothetical protein
MVFQPQVRSTKPIFVNKNRAYISPSTSGTHTCIFGSMCVFVYVRVHVYMHVCVYVCVYVCVCGCVGGCVCGWMCV